MCICSNTAQLQIACHTRQVCISANLPQRDITLHVAQRTISSYRPACDTSCSHNAQITADVAYRDFYVGITLCMAIATNIADVQARCSVDATISPDVFQLHLGVPSACNLT